MIIGGCIDDFTNSRPRSVSCESRCSTALTEGRRPSACEYACDSLISQGLAFSVAKGMRIPPSLRNIYKEMAEEIPGLKIPKHG